MKKQFKLGVIGCGATATSILRGIVLSELIKEKKIIVSDISEENLDKLDYLGIYSTLDNKFVAENSEYLLVAVNPKDWNAVVKSLKGYLPQKIISVMPFVRKSVIKNSLGVGLIKVARCSVNLPCSIGSGAIGIDMTDYNNSQDDSEFISNIFNCIGTVVSLDESKLDAVTAISGYGPVYSLMLIDSLMQSGIKQGLSKNAVKTLVAQTLMGSAEMVLRDENSVEELMVQACGKGGAGVEALKHLQNNEFENIIDGAVAACLNRVKENL